MYTIEIANEQQGLMVDVDFLQEVATEVLRSEQVSEAEVSIALVDGEMIWKINREFLGHDYPTDVISFLLESSSTGPTPVDGPRGAGLRLSGEVVISADMAMELAADCNAWNPAQEAVLYLIHGLLHLCGYDDVSDAERRIMRRREREILARWNLVPPELSPSIAEPQTVLGASQ